ncbi:MAG: TonB-dependent receptor [Flavobacteriaceae bacterium]|nr:TonB-dependent receptor [Flavobacteriaceae bacterium]
MKNVLFLCSFLISCITYAQTNVRGTVVDESGIPVVGANVVAVGTGSGTATDFDGNFALLVDAEPPFALEISNIGYAMQRVSVAANNQSLSITLVAGSELDEVVLSASRTPERIFESPVTVERFGLKEIKNTASADFYDGLENLKGVDINTNSLTFKSINTRGFATFANTRFMQLVDGMDNSAPALNFPLGNLLGMTDTDVQSVEILPGAASALYGANAFNGILFMRSKSPFDFQGISVSLKQGLTSQEAVGDNPYTDVSMRIGHKFNDKFAAKLNVGYLSGTDWGANNTAGKVGTGADRGAINYDGVNVYGDEVSTNLNGVAQALVGLGILPAGAEQLVPSENVSRTGYNEADLTDYEAQSIKADWGLYYRPFEDDLEISYVGKYGTGSTLYQGANRYAIDNFVMTQHKLEVKNDNFFVRGYVTEDDAGDSYDMIFTGININRAWKDDQTWFGEYAGAFVQGQLYAGLTPDQAHAFARQTADTGRFEPGSDGYNNAFNTSVNDPNLSTGSKFQDNSKIYHADYNYNFSELFKPVEIQVGGSFRTYSLNSSGTIYTDSDGPIDYSEMGFYTQMQKKFQLADQLDLKLTGSVRYDKSELFDGFFSPRLAAGFTLADNHNIRASVQTGFRNPTTQDLYIGLDVGRAVLVGGASNNPERDVRDYALSPTGQAITGAASLSSNSTIAYENSFFASSVGAFAATGNVGALEVANSNFVKPEQVTSIDFGYRGKLGKIIIDANWYYNTYNDFISNETVIAPLYGDVGLTQALPDGTPLAVAAIASGDYQVFQTYTNSEEEINSYGGSIGISTKVFGGYDLAGSYTYAVQDREGNNSDFNTNFNTPQDRIKMQFGNTEVFKNFGFNTAWRYTGSYEWEATFGNGTIEAYNVVDVQLNYRMPDFFKSTFKLGAANVLGDEYNTAFGTGNIGSMYYLSWTINNL